MEEAGIEQIYTCIQFLLQGARNMETTVALAAAVASFLRVNIHRAGIALCSVAPHFAMQMAEPQQLFLAPAACDFASERMSFSRFRVL